MPSETLQAGAVQTEGGSACPKSSQIWPMPPSKLPSLGMGSGPSELFQCRVIAGDMTRTLSPHRPCESRRAKKSKVSQDPFPVWLTLSPQDSVPSPSPPLWPGCMRLFLDLCQSCFSVGRLEEREASASQAFLLKMYTTHGTFFYFASRNLNRKGCF